MKFPIRLATLLAGIAWIATGITALITKDYLLALVALSSVGYCFQIAIHLREEDRLRRLIHQSQTRTDKKDPHL
jgi:hypothetical protein